MMCLWSKNLLLKEKDPYNKNQVLLEKSAAGTFSVSLETGVYDIWCIGGGGGGSNGAGGAGAGIHVRAKLLKGTYSCAIGAAGKGADGYVRNHNGDSGSASSITGVSATITANGGVGRNGRRNGGGGGTTGTLTYSFKETFTIIAKTTDGKETNLSFLTNTTDGAGAGGIAQSSDTGVGYAGKAGYVKIVYYGLKL
ncbi:MAG: hypothetical protein NC218_04350 [Acetobacter sp.]|nr:hypothetical protein [Acetobacter sp.]